MGKKALYHPRVKIKHQIPYSRLTLEYFDKRAFYQGVCDSYTRIRANKGKTDLDMKIKTNSIPNILIKTIFIQLRKRLKGIIKSIFVVPPQKKENLQILMTKRFKEKYQNGYNFHQNACRNNDILKNWVLRADYFDYQLPK